MERKESIVGKQISRRKFLRNCGAATVVAVGAGTALSFAGCSNGNVALEETEEPETGLQDEVFYTSCKTACPSSCFFKVYVRDGKAIRTTAAEQPDPMYNRICLKGFSFVEHAYNEKRIQYPMKRVGERGSGEWERISWDEAITTITDNWKEVREQYGPTSIAVIDGGALANANFFGQYKLANTLGAYRTDTGYDKALAYAGNNYVGNDLFWYANEYGDMLNSKTIIVWASNITEGTPQLWHILADAQDLGATLIVVDPNYSGVASKADIHVPLRTATDGALALGMIKWIIDNGLQDDVFLKAHTVAPFLVKPDGTFLRESDLAGYVKPVVAEGEKTPEAAKIVWDEDKNTSAVYEEVTNPAITGSYEVEGIAVRPAYEHLLDRVNPYTLAYTAEICDIPESLIERVAKVYATNTPSWIYFGIGLDHYGNAHGAYGAMHTLGMVTGNMCKPGACAGQGVSSANIMSNMNLRPPEGVTPPGTIPSGAMPEVITKGEFAGKQYNIKSLAVLGGNPLGNQCDRQAWVEAFKAVDFVFSVNIEEGDTTLYSDIVLPASSLLEYDDLHLLNVATPFMYIQEKAIEPLYESKPEFEICRLLLERLNLEDNLPLTTVDWNKSELDTDNARALGITWDALKEKKALRYLPGDMFIHAAGGKFKTPTGKAQFYIENPKPNQDLGFEFDVEKERMPFWEPPIEAWNFSAGGFPKNEISNKYPLIYYNGSQRFRTHTTYARTKLLNELAVEPTVRLSRIDAEARGIVDGDTVKVFNDRGYVIVKAQINDGLRTGMLNMDRGWQYDQFIEGHYSDLTHRVANPICRNNEYYDTLCEVEKV